MLVCQVAAQNALPFERKLARRGLILGVCERVRKNGSNLTFPFCFQNKPSVTNYWQKGDKNDLDAKAAYEALLTISLLVPRSSSWNNFTHMVKQRALQDYNFSFPHDEEVSLNFVLLPLTVVAISSALYQMASSFLTHIKESHQCLTNSSNFFQYLLHTR